MSYTLHYLETPLDEALAALPSPEVRRSHVIPEGYGEAAGRTVELAEGEQLVLWHEPEMLALGRPHDLVGVFISANGSGFDVNKGDTVCFNGQSEFQKRLKAAGLLSPTWWD